LLLNMAFFWVAFFWTHGKNGIKMVIFHSYVL
jgi:hypothetical protein